MQPSTPFRSIWQNYKRKSHLPRISSTLENTTGGQVISPNQKKGILWVRLTDYKYPQTALLLPRKYQKEALCEAHSSIFGGHDANLKTYMKSPHPTTGQVSTKISKCTCKPASPASKGKEPRQSRHLFSHCQYQKDQIRGSMLTYSGQC